MDQLRAGFNRLGNYFQGNLASDNQPTPGILESIAVNMEPDEIEAVIIGLTTVKVILERPAGAAGASNQIGLVVHIMFD